MKTLILTREYPPHVYGGAGVHVEYLTRELSRLQEVEVRCFGEQDLREDRLSVRGYRLPEGLLDGAPELFTSPLGTLARCVSFAATPSGADVVHCHTWYSHFGGILCKLLYELPLVVSIHSLEPLRPWKREQLGRGYEVSSWVERTALEMADRIIAVSEETKRDVLEGFRVHADRIAVIPNGIDVDEYRYDPSREALERYGVPPGLPYVLFVGRITRQKGLPHLLDAVEHFDPGTGVVLCAGEPDTEEIGREVEAHVASLRQEREHVYWIREMVTRRAAIQLYSHSALFCCPSIYEPFGIINLEAMACNAPVVASAVGGIKEVVVPEETGLLVPYDPADAEGFARGLAAAVNRLMGDPELRRRMGAAGRRRAEDRFSWKAVAAQIHAEYRRVTGSASS